MEKTETQTGFTLINFDDLYGVHCSLQKSSLATEDAIWLGVDDANPQIFNADAICGWKPYPIPDTVLLSTRMHLTRDQVKALLPHLQRFVKTGEI